MNWVQMWTMRKANRAETQLWLSTTIVPLIREVDNPDGSKKTKTTTDSTPRDCWWNLWQLTNTPTASVH